MRSGTATSSPSASTCEWAPAGTPERLGRDLARGLALYLHIPFCTVRCPYCDFNTYQGLLHLLPPFVEALEREIRLWGDLLGRPPLRTLFLGGGTPSLLDPSHLERLLRAVEEAFAPRRGMEVTLEANPDDVEEGRVRAYRALGVNRLSLGVQSLEDRFLRLLGRRHSAEAARRAYRAARRAGMGNINLDLMYGLPGQTLEEWRRDLDAALALAPDHLSAYCLTLEPGTPMERWVREGRLPAPDEDLAAEMYREAHERLGRAGYRHYEISNWARPGRESRHNRVYWRAEPYLGLGPGAHSYLGGCRFREVPWPGAYIRRVEGWWRRGAVRVEALTPEGLRALGPVEGAQALTREEEMDEFLFLGLRLAEGVREGEFRRRFGEDLGRRYGPALGELEALGLLERRGGRVRLTLRGWLLSNEVFVRLVGGA